MTRRRVCAFRNLERREERQIIDLDGARRLADAESRPRQFDEGCARQERHPILDLVLRQQPVPVDCEVGQEGATGAVIVGVAVESRMRHHGRRSAAVLLLIARARRHADVAPRVPVDDDGASRRARGAIDREGIEEGVGCGVVDLAREAEGRGNGREQDEEVEWLVDQPVEMDRAGDLGTEDALHRAQRFALDRLIVHHAGGVDDAGDRPELGTNLLQRALDAGAVGDIACADGDLCAERPDRANSAHALRADALRRNDAQDIVPLDLGRKLTAREQREFDLLQPRKMLGDLQGDTAEAAGDDVDAAIAQPTARRDSQQGCSICAAIGPSETRPAERLIDWRAPRATRRAVLARPAAHCVQARGVRRRYSAS